MTKLTKNYLTKLTYEIIGAAIEVHKEMGPGLLEKIYEVCMVEELKLRGIKVKSQQTIPVIYKGVSVSHIQTPSSKAHGRSFLSNAHIPQLRPF